MNMARHVLLVAGAIAVVLGLVWIGQGLGYFPYPARSFMIGQTRWAWRGLALAAAGALIIAFAGRRR